MTKEEELTKKLEESPLKKFQESLNTFQELKEAVHACKVKFEDFEVKIDHDGHLGAVEHG